MSNAEWYRRALGAATPGRPQVPQAYAPQQTPVYQPPAHTGEQGLDWNQIHAPVPNVNTATIPRGAVTPENFLEMAKFWKGGPGKQAAMECPQCRGVLFRRFVGRMEAAPLCEQCGYNGLFVQAQQAMA